MIASGSAFSTVKGVEGVYVARSGALSCTAIQLRGGGLCLYSPIAEVAEAQSAQLKTMGGVSAFLAPNHYHNKGLRDHLGLFPHATLVCSSSAEPRLRKISGLNFADLVALRTELSASMKVLEPPGLKTGEVWVQIKHAAEVAWVVADAFSAERYQQDAHVNTPTMLGTFPKYGVKDAAIFKNWVKQQISLEQPTILLPCHGPPVKRPDLGSTLIGLLDETL